MRTEEDLRSGTGCTAHGILNGEHARIAVELLLNAFDATTANQAAMEAALRQADALEDPVLSSGVRGVLESLAQTRMLLPGGETPETGPHLPL